MNSEIKPLLDDLIAKVSEGKILEAFEEHYAEEIVMQENEDEPRVGKDENRAYEEKFVHGVTEMHDFKIIGIAYGDNYSAYESHMDVTHSEWGRVQRTQVATQHWQDGKIVREKFYYAQ